MNEFSYGADAIRAWAEFSGDFNPVHFDMKRAAALGLPQVPVHGMRVMLDIKSKLFAHAVRPQPLFFKAALRSPVLRDGHYTLGAEANKGGMKYELSDAIDRRVCITGVMRPASPEQLLAFGGSHASAAEEPWHSFSIGRSELVEGAAGFAACAPPSSDFWLLLDALLFSKVLSAQGLFGKVAHHIGARELASADQLMQRAIVLQTHHSTLIPEAAQRFEYAADMRDDAIVCRISEPVIDGNIVDGIVAEVSLDAWAQDTPLLRTTVGLKISC